MGKIRAPIYVREGGMPIPPAHVADAVEEYARNHGRTGTLKFIPTIILGTRVYRGAWVVELSLRPNDPRLLAYQQGRAREPETERIWLHVSNPKRGLRIPGTTLKEPQYVGIDIHQLGADGVKRFLEKGNTWSGRGEFDSLQDQLRRVRQMNEDNKRRERKQAKEAAVDRAMDGRRQHLRIPFITAGIDLLRGKRHNEDSPKQDAAHEAASGA